MNETPPVAAAVAVASPPFEVVELALAEASPPDAAPTCGGPSKFLDAPPPVAVAVEVEGPDFALELAVALAAPPSPPGSPPAPPVAAAFATAGPSAQSGRICRRRGGAAIPSLKIFVAACAGSRCRIC